MSDIKSNSSAMQSMSGPTVMPAALKPDTPSFADISIFLEDFGRRFAANSDDIRRNLNDLHKVAAGGLAAHSQRRMAFAPGFNIFTITERANFEVTTHSAMIAALLDPAGAHEQGPLFLAGFLDIVKRLYPSVSIPDATLRWQIDREVRGVDILLTHLSPDVKIIIENKWFAADQDQQTVRYWKRLFKESRGRLASIPVLYLAPTRRAPRFDPKQRRPAQFNRDLKSISYATEIREWLSTTFPAIGSTRVRETVLQYLDLLEQFDEA